MGYTEGSQTSVPVKASDIVLALTRELAGFQSAPSPDEDPDAIRERLQALRKEVALDRLIILGPFGGIPASYRPNGYHVFLNMEQEFESVKQDLLKAKPVDQVRDGSSISTPTEFCIGIFGLSNPFSKFVEVEFGGPKTPPQAKSRVAEDTHHDSQYHLENLQLVRSVLSILPPSSSALLTTPEEAANSGKQPDTPLRLQGSAHDDSVTL